MDSIPSYEFHKIFHRVSRTVNLKGKFTPLEIEAALTRARNECGRLSESAARKNQRLFYRSKKIGLDKLIEHGFSRRVISEAIADPQGIVAQTLRYGYGEAKRRMLAQARSRIRVDLQFGRPGISHGRRVALPRTYTEMTRRYAQRHRVHLPGGQSRYPRRNRVHLPGYRGDHRRRRRSPP